MRLAWRNLSKAAVAAFILLVLGRGVLQDTRTDSSEFYVSPNGNDGNDGSLDRPWRTVGHALGELIAGDVLYLRSGTYYEHEMRLDLQGSAEAPITIRSYPGEGAIIDGGVPDFRPVPNQEWEVVRSDIGLYRSKKSFASDSSFARAWLVEDDVQLVEYESAENLESTNYGPLDGRAPLYMGPGLQLREDGHIYIRLAYNPNDLTDASGSPIDPTPLDTDPNHNGVAVSFARYIFQLDGASYLQLQDLAFANAEYILDARSGSHHITVSGCRLDFGSYGIVIRESIHDWEIYDCEFNNGVPDYVYWTDVKNRDGDVTEAYPEFQSVAISGTMLNFYIHDNVYRNSFDGITVAEGSSGSRIVNNDFMQLRDDSINLSKGIGNVEVSYNMMWHVMGGIANLSSDQPAGNVYIHHNVIDNSAYHRGGRPGNYREDNWPVWTVGSPFPGHDDGDRESWWKLYNNTVVSRQNVGHQWSPVGPDDVTGNEEKYVFNNIFFALDDAVIFRDDLETMGSHYDGNVVYQLIPDRLPVFTNFGDGGRYYSLQEFRMQSGTGWEGSGLEVDPRFDLAAIADPTFDPNTIWGRYKPHNARIFTPGASTEGFDWPEAGGADYRGAIPGSFDFTTFLPFS